MNTKYLHDTSADSSNDGTLTMNDVAGFFSRRKSILFISMGLLFTATLVWCIFGTKFYKSQGVIQIQKQDSEGFGLEGGLPGATATDNDALDYNVTLETQANILQSDTLALQVAKELNLENTVDFSGGKRFKFPHWMKPWAPVAEPSSVPLEDAPVRRAAVVKKFGDRLKVESVSGTRLIKISYSNPDPKLSAEVVNYLIRDFQDYTIQTRYTMTQQASAWLSGQLNDLKTQTEELQAKAIKLQRDTGMYGDDQNHNLILKKLEALNEGLVAAEGNRILKDAILHAVRNGDPELVSNLAGNSPIGAASQSPNGMSVVQSLRLQEASIKAQIAEDETKYGPNYPHMVELHGQLDGVDKALHAELGRVTGRAQSDYQIAADSENQARASFESQKRVALQTNDKVVQFALAKQEADESRNLYEDLLKKLKETGVLEGLRSTNISIVDHGLVPSLPSRPYAPIFLPISVGVGLTLGIFIALFVDLTDNSIHGIAEMQALTGESLFAVLPHFTATSSGSRIGERPSSVLQLQSQSRATSAADSREQNPYFVEAVRSLRTALWFSRSAAPPQVIKVSSPLEGEGKSTLTMTLGTVLAQQGARVLMVDADLRNPKLHSLANAANSPGLSTLLTSQPNAMVAQQVSGVPGLQIISAGPATPYPAELLGSSRMKALVEDWRGKYDFILLDSPALLPVTDSMVLNQFTDFNLMVVRFGQTPKASFRCAYRALCQTVEPQAIGVVVNDFRRNSAAYEDYYGYKGNVHNLISKGNFNERAN